MVMDRCLLTWCKFQNALHAMRRDMRSQSGATTVEYALLIAVVVIGIIAAATYMFDPLKEFFQEVVKKVKKTAGV
jgi:Flp pilus assembly pilin Flp